MGIYSPNGIEGIEVRGTELTRTQTWLAHDAPYISGGFTIGHREDSVVLTVNAGAVIRMTENAGIWIDGNGGLTLVGTEDAPITFTSAADTPAPGDWGNIEVRDGSLSEHNIFQHVIFEHGSRGGFGLVDVRNTASAAISNCTFRHSAAEGLHIGSAGEVREFENNTIMDNEGAAVLLWATEVHQLGPGVYGPNAIDGVQVYSERHINHSGSWRNLGVPYITGGFSTEGTESEQAILTVEAGTVILMEENGSIVVRPDSALILDGTPEDRVVITSAAESPTPGDWNNIRIWADTVTASMIFRHADISYGGGTGMGQLDLYTSGAEITLEDVVFSNSGDDCDIYGDGTFHASGGSHVVCEI